MAGNFFIFIAPGSGSGSRRTKLLRDPCGSRSGFEKLYIIDPVSGMRGELLPGGVEEAQQVNLHAHVSHGKKVDAMLLFSGINSFQSLLDFHGKLGRSRQIFLLDQSRVSNPDL
jgi:hypothetical protein